MKTSPVLASLKDSGRGDLSIIAEKSEEMKTNQLIFGRYDLNSFVNEMSGGRIARLHIE